eukprot:TRINITY_DN5491_c2_g1_i1.p1 TRINITY_DN5491_c2_g1~~TRINITY_DN5491_c2_g1_i1.p1  ORF type:complete len:123 (+),score=0.39 TRINITY_DN5491_c2_g1_i1:296-664(+)
MSKDLLIQTIDLTRWQVPQRSPQLNLVSQSLPCILFAADHTCPPIFFRNDISIQSKRSIIQCGRGRALEHPQLWYHINGLKNQNFQWEILESPINIVSIISVKTLILIRSLVYHNLKRITFI